MGFVEHESLSEPNDCDTAFNQLSVGGRRATLKKFISRIYMVLID